MILVNPFGHTRDKKEIWRIPLRGRNKTSPPTYQFPNIVHIQKIVRIPIVHIPKIVHIPNIDHIPK